MARLNRSTLSFIGLMVSLSMAPASGCGFETHGTPIDTTGAAGGAGGNGGTAGAGGMGGEAGGTSCEPGTKRDCYSGPLMTANVGTCKPGTQTCLADGTGFDVCTGEVLPALENCIAPGDEDCDTYSDLKDSECKCTVPNTKTMCNTGMAGVCTIGTGICSADGRSVDMCAPVTAASAENCATSEDEDCDGAVGPACTGDPKWVSTSMETLATTKDDAVFAVTPTSDGYVIAGMIDGTLEADGYGITAGNIYVAKINTNGAFVWQNEYPCSKLGAARGVAVDPNGEIIVVGEFEGAVKLDGIMNATTPSNHSDLFLLKLDTNGNHLWNKVVGAGNHQVATDVATDANGNIFITGFATNDTFTFGGAMFNPDNDDVFIAKFTSVGNHSWSKLYVNMGSQRGRRLAVTRNGDVVIIGDAAGDINLGGSDLMNGGNRDIFVARYAGMDGTHLWSKTFGKMGDQLGRGIGVGPNDTVLITGGFAGTIDWKAGVTMAALGTSDVYAAKLDGATGDYVTHTHGAKSGASAGTSIGADASGNVTIFGHFNGAVDFGGQELTSSTSDTFLVKLKVDDWKPVWTKPFGKMGNQFGWDLFVANDGSTFVGGTFFTELQLPTMMTTIPSTGASADLFAVLVNP